MLAIALALGSSLAWGVSDFLGGVKSRAVPLLAVLVVSQGDGLGCSRRRWPRWARDQRGAASSSTPRSRAQEIASCTPFGCKRGC
jgi:hypothetical protein